MITIVIAVRNGAATLAACLASIGAQTYARREVIVMDAASTDGTVEILRGAAGVVTYWESEPDRGIAHAWNKALARAGGEWLLFLGADDAFADPGALGRMAAAAEPGLDFVSAKVRLIDERGHTVLVSGAPFVWARMKIRMAAAHTGALHHRRLFEQMGLFSEDYRIASDYEFLLRCGPRLRAKFVDDVIVDMRFGGLSTSQFIPLLREFARAQAATGVVPPWLAWVAGEYWVMRKRAKAALKTAGFGRWLKP